MRAACQKDVEFSLKALPPARSSINNNSNIYSSLNKIKKMWEKWVKGVNRYELPTVKSIGHGEVMYGMVTIVRTWESC